MNSIHKFKSKNRNKFVCTRYPGSLRNRYTTIKSCDLWRQLRFSLEKYRYHKNYGPQFDSNIARFNESVVLLDFISL